MVLRILFLLAVSCSVAKAQVALVADSVTGLPGSQVDVSIRPFQWQDIVSFQGTIEWDTSVVELDTVYQYFLPGMNLSNFGFALVPNGKLTYSWNEANLQGTNLPDSSVVFTIRFDLTGTPGSASPVTFTSDPTLIEFVDDGFMVLNYTVTGGEVMIEDTTMVGIEEMGIEDWEDNSLVVYPNPVHEHSVVEWRSGEEDVNASVHGTGSQDGISHPAEHVIADAIQWRLLNMAGQTVDGGRLNLAAYSPAHSYDPSNPYSSGYPYGTSHFERDETYRIKWNDLIQKPLSNGVYWLEWDTAGAGRMKKVFIEEVK